MARGGAGFDDDTGFRDMKMRGEQFDEGGVSGAVNRLLTEIDREFGGGIG